MSRSGNSRRKGFAGKSVVLTNQPISLLLLVLVSVASRLQSVNGSVGERTGTYGWLYGYTSLLTGSKA